MKTNYNAVHKKIKYGLFIFGYFDHRKFDVGNGYQHSVKMSRKSKI